jgi:hypothetical protein
MVPPPTRGGGTPRQKDLHFAGGSGLRLLGSIRRFETFCAIPVVIPHGVQSAHDITDEGGASRTAMIWQVPSRLFSSDRRDRRG